MALYCVTVSNVSCTSYFREVAEADFWNHVLERHGLMKEEYQTVADSLKSPKLAGNVDDTESEKVRKTILFTNFFVIKSHLICPFNE